ncbi:methylenetetrahydrofolate reductase (NADPH) [Microlunatus soli]|uniref:Methylenetetrahydrofolate reductase n=2 Tax=Microlunatus soli TaxID=630515 RepID=A0A1H1TLU5_9ACTN|nr:methylenetetrahydrofolate reductase (NADPH) [Microlunatus soli]
MERSGPTVVGEVADRPRRRRTRPSGIARRQPRHPALQSVLSRPRFEVLPTPGVEAQVITELPTDATVTVTASPRQGITATVDLAIGLAGRGVHAVPHLSARLIPDTSVLRRIIGDLEDAGIDEVFVIGGDPTEPVGEFGSALDLLSAMRTIGHRFTIGIAGYPEPHPRIADDLTIQAMWDKRREASYIVSQLCFDPKLLTSWIRRVRRRGVQLPILIGVAGPADVAKLLRIGRRIGVGGSARLLSHHTGLLRVARPGSWRPDGLLGDLEPAFADPSHGLTGVHIYTFNALRAAERWRREMLQQNGADPP